MDGNFGKLTVYFDNPFWVGMFERTENGKLSVCRVVFGAEPNDCEVFEFVLKNFCKLKFSPAVDVAVKKEVKNPKRMQREVKKQLMPVGIGTKSQQALNLQREENKSVRKRVMRKERDIEKQRQFELKRQKRKEKHRGK